MEDLSHALSKALDQLMLFFTPPCHSPGKVLDSHGVADLESDFLATVKMPGSIDGAKPTLSQGCPSFGLILANVPGVDSGGRLVSIQPKAGDADLQHAGSGVSNHDCY